MPKRVVVLLVGVAMVASMLAVASLAGAQEAQASATLNAQPDTTWMTNGIVYSVIRSGDYIYVGGKFTRARVTPNGKAFLATNVARFHADTGVGDPTWTPDVTGADPTITKVYALAAAGGNIWIGGKFDTVKGSDPLTGTDAAPVARRNLAAVSEATGTVNANIDPLVGLETNTTHKVLALLASETKVYVGGIFSQVDGISRPNLAAFNLDPTTDDALLDNKWKPKTKGQVRSLAFSENNCDGDDTTNDATVFAGGKFRSAAGSTDKVYAARETIARFDPASGALHPWAIPVGTIPNELVAADLAVTCERISGGFLGSNWARSFHLDTGDLGTQVWEAKTGGDVQTVAMLDSDTLVIGGHFSQVEQPNGVRVKRERIALLDLQTGAVDPSWAPAFEGFWGPWDLLVDENHLYVGGGFTGINGITQTNFARFTFTT